jgi:hypothetical protein
MKLKLFCFITFVSVLLFSAINGFQFHGSFQRSFRNKPLILKVPLQVSHLPQSSSSSFASFKVFPNILGTTSTVLFADTTTVSDVKIASTKLSPASSQFSHDDFQLIHYYFRIGNNSTSSLIQRDPLFITFRDLFTSSFNPNSTNEFIHVHDIQPLKELFSKYLTSLIERTLTNKVRIVPGELNRLFFIYDRIYEKISQQLRSFSSSPSSLSSITQEMKEKFEESKKALNDWKSVICEEIIIPEERLFEKKEEVIKGQNNSNNSNNTISITNISSNVDTNPQVKMIKKLVFNSKLQNLLYRYFGYEYTPLFYQNKMKEMQLVHGNLTDYFIKLINLSVSRINYLSRKITPSDETIQMRRISSNNFFFSRLIT